MSDELTKGMPRDPSFEEKVLTRLDPIGAELQQRAVDTKPIWERALAEILELKQGQTELKQGQAELKEGLEKVEEGLRDVERKIDVLSRDVIQVRADQLNLDRRVDKLEPKPVQ